MYRIIFVCFLFSFNSWADCFSYKMKPYKVIRKGVSQVIIASAKDSELSSLFFCSMKEKVFVCHGDDDSGSFKLDDKRIKFTSDVILGVPDGPSEVIQFKEAKSIELKACTK